MKQTLEIVDEQLSRVWKESFVAASWHQVTLSELEKLGYSLVQSDFECYLALDGKRHGLCEGYDEQKRVISRSYYQCDLLHGPVEYYSSLGKKLSQSHYVVGKKCGPFWLWYPSGSLYSEQHFVDGELHGKQSYFYENGQLKTQMHYEKGQVHGALQQYFENGRVRRYSEFVMGVRQGKDLIWSKSGSPVLEASFDQGQPTGQLNYYHDGGVLAEKYTYLGPAWRFHVERYDREGRLWQKGTSLDDNGFEQQSFNSSGKLTEHLIHQRDSSGKTLHTQILYKEP